MEQDSAQGKQAIDALVGLGHMRVWSVIITIFGDGVVGRGGKVASTTLAALTEQMGVKPEAFRVALSRLTKDGWIERSKSGRLSFYRLSTQGLAEFGPATARIYAPQAGGADGWHLVVLPTAVGEPPLGGAVSLGGRCYLSPHPVKNAEALTVSGTIGPVPDWVKDRLGVADIAGDYVALRRVLRHCSGAGVSDLQAAVIRVLLVHQWRRLVLRHADLPLRFFPDDWQGESCRIEVHRLHAALAQAADRWFDAQIV